MPKINEQTKNYPLGKRMTENDTAIPDGAQFVIAPAADIWIGEWTKPGSCVFPEWARQVDAAAKAGVLMGAKLTLRVAGNDFPIDYLAPEKDRQLTIFLHALKNKTYAFIVLSVVSTDSDVATVKAARYFRDQLEKQTGKKVFLITKQAIWENSETWDVELGRENSDWPLLIVSDYETKIDAAIETPGLWKLANGLIWEEKPGVYRAWPPVDTWYFADTPEQPEPEKPEPEKPDQPAPEISDLGRIATACERIAHALEKLADLAEKLRGLLK